MDREAIHVDRSSAAGSASEEGITGTIQELVTRYYPESRFGGFTDVDGTISFYTRVNSLLEPWMTALDVGCGRGVAAEDTIPFRRALRTLRGKCARVIGIDVDSAAQVNPLVDEFRLMEGGRWPLADASVHLAVCEWVLEHVSDPTSFFAEARRVLAPGGHLCLRTANLLGYVGFASRLLPHGLHPPLLARLQPARQMKDVFPTWYRCNTVWRLRAMLRRYGFDGVVYGYEAEPAYFTNFPFLYRLAVWHQRLMLNPFRLALFAFARRGHATPTEVTT